MSADSAVRYFDKAKCVMIADSAGKVTLPAPSSI